MGGELRYAQLECRQAASDDINGEQQEQCGIAQWPYLGFVEQAAKAPESAEGQQGAGHGELEGVLRHFGQRCAQHQAYCDDGEQGGHRAARRLSVADGAAQRHHQQPDFQPFEQHALEGHGPGDAGFGVVDFVAGFGKFLGFVVQLGAPGVAADGLDVPAQTEQQQKQADGGADEVDVGLHHIQRRAGDGDERGHHRQCGGGCSGGAGPADGQRHGEHDGEGFHPLDGGGQENGGHAAPLGCVHQVSSSVVVLRVGFMVG